MSVTTWLFFTFLLENKINHSIHNDRYSIFLVIVLNNFLILPFTVLNVTILPGFLFFDWGLDGKENVINVCNPGSLRSHFFDFSHKLQVPIQMLPRCFIFHFLISIQKLARWEKAFNLRKMFWIFHISGETIEYFFNLFSLYLN